MDISTQVCSLDKNLSGIEDLTSFISKNISNKILILCIKSNFLFEQTCAILDDKFISVKQIIDYKDAVKDEDDCIFACQIDIKDSFCIEDKIFIAVDSIFGIDSVSEKSPKHGSKKRSNILSEIKNDDYIIHRDYGLGIFRGIQAITSKSKSYDCLKLEYANKDILYIPVTYMYKISSYSSEAHPRLDSLSANSWKRKRDRAVTKIKTLAHDIIKISSERSKVKATPFDVRDRSDIIEKFENGFEYVETPTQLEAISDVYSDISSECVSDRVISGDVGSGKTEVAFRAMFAVVCGKVIGLNFGQCIFICPTTFLAMQNYKLALDRFKDFPKVKISMLISKLTKKERHETGEKLKNGEIDILIATHSCMSSKLEFKNLSLVVYDEEHCFGVKQKCFFEKRYKKIHKISLTATPIPRTLQNTLSGIQSISSITDMPFGRLPVITSIISNEINQINEIMNKAIELGDVVIIVTPKIRDIEKLENSLKSGNLNIKVCSLHGDKSSIECSKIMEDFEAKKYNVLIATTIIASGMDFGCSNAIIINRCNMFGMAQLHQIRGRVGRRDCQSYCYMMYDLESPPSEDAFRRIKSVCANNAIGISGISVAYQDMKIRGYGNLVGKEQSGVIDAIGPELYYDLLNHYIINGSENENYELENCDVDLCIDISVSDKYISNSKEKIVFYKKVADARSILEVDRILEDVKSVYGSSIDVGSLNLINSRKIAILGLKIKLCSIKSKKNKIYFDFGHQKLDYVLTVLEIIQKLGLKANFSSSNQGSIVADFEEKDSRIIDKIALGLMLKIYDALLKNKKSKEK